MTHLRSFLATLSLAVLSALAMPGHAQEKVIGFAMPNLASSFWISSAYGVEDEAAKLKAKVVKLSAGGDANSALQIAQIQDLVQRKVDVIIIGATNGDAIRSAVDQAIAQGVPVIGLSSPPNTSALAAVVSADHYDMGRLQARCLGPAMQGKGTVAMMAGPSGQMWADRRALGFKETLANEFPQVRVVAENRLGDNRNAAMNTAEDWLQRFPDLGGVYAATDDMAAGVVAALKSAKALQKVRVSASNFSPSAQQMLKDGELVCTSIQQIVSQGRAAVRVALDAAAKRPIAEKVIAMPAVAVTRDTVSTVDLSGVVAPVTYRP